MKRLRFLLSFFLLMASRVAWSQDLQTAIVVWYDTEDRSYENYSIFTSSNPRFTVSEGYANLEADGEYEYNGNTYVFGFAVPLSESTPYRLSFEKRSYQGFTPEDYEDETAVQHVNTDALRPQFRIQADQLMVAALKPGTQVSLYAPDGKLISTAKVDSNGRAQAELPKVKGTVIVKATDGITFKVMVK